MITMKLTGLSDKHENDSQAQVSVSLAKQHKYHITEVLGTLCFYSAAFKNERIHAVCSPLGRRRFLVEGSSHHFWTFNVKSARWQNKMQGTFHSELFVSCGFIEGGHLLW